MCVARGANGGRVDRKRQGNLAELSEALKFFFRQREDCLLRIPFDVYKRARVDSQGSKGRGRRPTVREGGKGDANAPPEGRGTAPLYDKPKKTARDRSPSRFPV